MILHNIQITSNRFSAFLFLRHSFFHVIAVILCFLTLFSAGVGVGEKEAFMYLGMEDVVVRVVGDRLEVAAEPVVLNDLSVVLSRLLDLTKHLKRKAEFVQAKKRAEDPVDQARRAVAFDARARDVFCVFQKHMNNGCGGDKRLALQETRRELKLMACDAKLFVAQGRRLQKNRRLA